MGAITQNRTTLRPNVRALEGKRRMAKETMVASIPDQIPMISAKARTFAGAYTMFYPSSSSRGAIPQGFLALRRRGLLGCVSSGCQGLHGAGAPCRPH